MLVDLTTSQISTAIVLHLFAEAYRRSKRGTFSNEPPAVAPTVAELARAWQQALDEHVDLEQWARYVSRQHAARKPWKGRDAHAATMLHVWMSGHHSARAELPPVEAIPGCVDSAALHRLWDELPDHARRRWFGFTEQIERTILDVVLRPPTTETTSPAPSNV